MVLNQDLQAKSLDRMSDIIKNMFSKGREAEVVEEVAAVDNSNNNPVNNNLMDVNFWNQVASKLRKLE